jgi:hypothetical protein
MRQRTYDELGYHHDGARVAGADERLGLPVADQLCGHAYRTIAFSADCRRDGLIHGYYLARIHDLKFGSISAAPALAQLSLYLLGAAHEYYADSEVSRGFNCAGNFARWRVIAAHRINCDPQHRALFFDLYDDPVAVVAAFHADPVRQTRLAAVWAGRHVGRHQMIVRSALAGAGF